MKHKNALILFLTVSVVVSGCTQRPLTKHQKKAGDNIKYLALGDSYTIGESVPVTQRYPVQLAVLLREQGYKIDAPLIIAKTGWTTDELVAGITAENPEGPYELVSLLIGVNNQYRGRDINDFRQEFRSLLKQAIGFAGGQAQKVFVLSIPDWGVTPFAESRDRVKIAGEIDAYNTAKREETDKLNVLYINITPVSREAASNTSLVADDGLHPSGKMYAAWVELALPGVKTLLDKRKSPTK